MFRSLRLPMALMAALAVSLHIAASPAPAAEKIGGAIDWTPADAAFYSASLRQKEVIEIIANSNAWAKFRAIPSVKMVWDLAELQINQPGGPLGMVQQLMQLPENQQLADMGIDMVSNEIAVYGDADWAPLVEYVLGMMNDIRYAGLTKNIKDAARIAGQEVPDEDEKKPEPGRVILEAIAKQPELLKVPSLVIAFKISDAKVALNQLKRLEVLAGFALAQNKKVSERLKRVKLGGGDYLTFNYDGDLVPDWSEVEEEIQKLEKKEGEFDKVIERLKALTVSASIGVRENYLIISIGRTNDHLAAIGSGPVLADHPELKPLVAAKDKRLTGIGYMSSKMASAVLAQKKDLDNIALKVQEILPATKLDKQLQERISGDVKKFLADVRKYVPDPGSVLSYEFLTPRGSESYTYNRMQNVTFDSSKPLSILEHLGGAPLAALVGRSKQDPAQYDLMVKWLQTIVGYVDEYVPKQIEKEEDRAKWKELREFSKPLLARLDKATREMLIPAFADGQGGLVLDAKISSNQWFPSMPKTKAALPMLEVGIVSSVSDPELLKKAVAEYKDVADAIVEKMKQMDAKGIPADYKIPLPEKRDVGGGALYSYELKGTGVDPQIAPVAGLSKNLLILSSSPKQAERVLQGRPLAAGGVLEDRTRPLAMAGFLDWAGLVDALTPWIDFGVRVGTAEAAAAGGGLGLLAVDDAGKIKLEPAEIDSEATKEILDQVHTGLEILKTLRAITSATYLEGNVTVTHTEMHWQDVKK